VIVQFIRPVWTNRIIVPPRAATFVLLFFSFLLRLDAEGKLFSIVSACTAGERQENRTIFIKEHVENNQR